MTKKYVKNPEAGNCYLPGVGWLWEGQTLTGDQYAKYAPGVLLEVPDEPKKPPLESTSYDPKPLTEPAPGPAPVLPESPPPETKKVLEEEGEDLAVSVKRPRGRSR